MPGAVEKLVSELGVFFEPLANSLESGADFGRLMRRFGVDIDGAQLDAAIDSLGPLKNGIFDLLALSADLVDDGFQIADVRRVKDAATPIFELAAGLGAPFSSTVPAGMTPAAWAATLDSLPQELIDQLLTTYLRRRLGIALQILSLLDVYAPRIIPETGDPLSRGLEYRREIYNWDRLRQLLKEPDVWAREAYGWGVGFDTDKAITRLVKTIEYFGGSAYVDDMTEAQIAAFVPHLIGAPFPPGAALVPIWAEDDPATGGRAQVGLLIMPAGQGADSGLAFGPYSKGSLDQAIAVAEGLALSLEGDFGAAGGAVFRMLPSGLTLERGIGAAALSSDFGAELVVTGAGGGPMILIGDPDGTRVEIASAAARIGGEAGSTGFDFHLGAGVRSLKVVIDPGDDGLLSAVISDEIAITPPDVLVGYRYSTGIYFEGGTSVEITMPLDLALGPIRLHELTIEVDWAEAPTVIAAVTADITIGPLFAYAEGLGLSASIVPSEGGIIGNSHDLVFGFVPPTAYAISLDVEPISGGGMLDRREFEYRGALALHFTSIGFSAFGILNTRLPDGKDGFSFAASIFAEFTVPLGFGFFLTGVGGMIGINRTIDTAALRDVLYSGRMDNLLFPADPIRNAATILEDMAAILPPREGQHLFGPVAKIGWGQPVLVDIKIGLVLEVGAEVRLLILGGVAVNLPTREAALVSLNLSFFGEIDFGAETISFDATLEGSRVLVYTISGDIAVRTGWAPRLEHVASFGGLHPQFPKPANLPDLRRLTIAFGTNNPKVSLSAYTALTSNSLQFGARADVYFKGPKIWLVGRVAAEGWVYFDALIYFDPFAFDVSLGGGVKLLVDGKTKCSLGFSLRMRGPNTFRFNGKVWVTVCGIDVDFSVDHSWGSPTSIPAPTVDAVAVLRNALENVEGLEAVAPTGRVHGVSFAADDTPLIDPFGSVRLTQRAVPLGIEIEKIGEAQVSKSANLLDLIVRRRNGPAVSVSSAEQDFVRGHFFALSEAQRLGATAFDRYKSGFSFDAADLLGPTAQAITADYGYEYIIIPAEEDSDVRAGLTGPRSLDTAFADRFLGPQARHVAQRVDQLRPSFEAVGPISISSSVFVVAATQPALDAVQPPGAFTPRVQDQLISLGLAESTLSAATAGAIRLAREPDVALASNQVMADYVAMAAVA